MKIISSWALLILLLFLLPRLAFSVPAALRAPKSSSPVSKPEVVVSLIKSPAEELIFSKVKFAGKTAYTVEYRIGSSALRSRVVPESMYKNMRSSLPLEKEPGNVSATCEPDLSLEVAGKKTFYCSARLKGAKAEAFANWFKQTRQTLLK